jgi:hypothetical protein
MTSSLPSLLVLLGLFLPLSGIQPPVDLSGTWTMVPERSDSPEQAPPVNAIDLTIASGPATLRVNAVRDGVPSETTYAMVPGGTLAAGMVPADGNTSRAYWDGPRLVTERAGTIQGQTVSIRQVFALAGGGQEMTVETLVVVQHGYTLRGAQNYAAKTDVFVRRR